MEIQRSQPQPNSIRHSGKGLTDETLELFFEKKSILTHYGASLTIGGTLHRPSLSKLVKSNGEAPTIVFITGLLNEFLSFVPNALNAEEIVLYADKILAHCPTWTTADLVLCLKNGMDGKYGPIKFRWTWTSDFIEWVKKYDQEKEDFFYQKHLSAKNEERVDVLKFIPKHIVEKFNKVSAVDEKKPDISKIQIPDWIINQGVKAIDGWIEKYYKNAKGK